MHPPTRLPSLQQTLPLLQQVDDVVRNQNAVLNDLLFVHRRSFPNQAPHQSLHFSHRNTDCCQQGLSLPARQKRRGRALVAESDPLAGFIPHRLHHHCRQQPPFRKRMRRDTVSQTGKFLPGPPVKNHISPGLLIPEHGIDCAGLAQLAAPDHPLGHPAAVAPVGPPEVGPIHFR